MTLVHMNRGPQLACQRGSLLLADRGKSRGGLDGDGRVGARVVTFPDAPSARCALRHAALQHSSLRAYLVHPRPLLPRCSLVGVWVLFFALKSGGLLLTRRKSRTLFPPIFPESLHNVFTVGSSDS